MSPKPDPNDDLRRVYKDDSPKGVSREDQLRKIRGESPKYIAELRAAAEKAEQDAQKVMAEKDDITRRYREKARKATDEAAAAQKALLDAQVVEAALERDDLRQADIDRMARGLSEDARAELQRRFDARGA